MYPVCFDAARGARANQGLRDKERLLVPVSSSFDKYLAEIQQI